MTVSSSRRRQVVCVALLALAGMLAWACVWVTDQAVWQHRPIGFLGVRTARLLLLAGAAAALFTALVMTVARTWGSLFVARSLTAGLATALTTLLLEAVFMFVPQSHNVGYTLATHIWYERYWGRENSLGYRDGEHVRAADRKLVFVVGDSFTAGAGITDVAERFSDVLAARRPDVQVMNLGICGSDTTDEFRRLQAHPLRPDVVVLQYYPNDIDGAASRAGHRIPAFSPYQDLRSVKLRVLVRGSFLANFVYWQLPHDDGLAYEGFLASVYADAEVARLHRQELAQFCTWSRANGTPLVVVLFPRLEDLAWSRMATAGVKALFGEHGVPVLDVAELVEDLPLDQRRVNARDGHASALVHARVGAALAGLIPSGGPR